MEKKWEEALSRTKLLSVSVSPSSHCSFLSLDGTPGLAPTPALKLTAVQCHAPPSTTKNT